MTAVLSIFAHQDDETFSAGGTLARHASSGKVLAASVTSDPKRKSEFEDACGILGVEPILLTASTVNPHNQQVVFSEIQELLRSTTPKHVITHNDFDYHHEHRLVHLLVKEAVEWVSHTTSSKKAHQVHQLWAAETTVLIPFPEIYIDVTEYHRQFIEAIACYESQSHKGGTGFYSDFHSTRTKLRGIQADVEFAEAFLQIPIALAGSFKPYKVFQTFPSLDLS